MHPLVSRGRESTIRSPHPPSPPAMSLTDDQVSFETDLSIWDVSLTVGKCGAPQDEGVH